ncbi:MAG TPA: FG-GAP-like repeat-containing protein, partial [Nitrospirales bacterium]|nr:FG-GAP-like repeat-containing protein [Nitrospirales bacterium]
TVRLGSLPTANVTIGLSSDDTTEGTVSPTSLTFTSANGTTAQTVTVTGVDDGVVDGDVAYTIVTAAATSTDADYSGRNAADVSVTNTDDDVAGIAVTPTTGLTTTEAGGTATFTVVLDTLPLSPVTIGLSSSNTTEGTVSPASLTFSIVNGTTPQTVTVTGVNDSEVDGNVAYTIVTAAATSTDPIYNGRNAADVSVTNTDNDVLVPDVVGLTRAAAQTALTNADLTVGTVTTAFSESVPVGNVISQTPPAGNTETAGGPVALVISSGPAVFLMGVQNDPNTGPLVNSLYRLRTNGEVTRIGDLTHRTHGLAFVGSTLYSVEELTLSQQAGTPPKLYRLNPDTGATLATISLSLSTGESLEGGRGLATEPGTNQLWALLIVRSEVNSARRLVTINPTTGLATQKAKLFGNFMDLAFDSAGTLYAITDNRPGGSTQPARIYTVNRTTGQATEFLDVSAGAVAGQPNFRESETIGMGPSANLLYHLSGQNKVTSGFTKNILFETIHRTTKARTPIALSGPDFFVTTALALVPPTRTPALGDLDASGTADVIWRNRTDGSTAIWLMDGTRIAAAGFPGGVPVIWQIAGVGDVNGDGKADVIWRNGTSGTVAVWLMNGVSVTAVGFPGSTSTDFEISGVGDVNGDGKADLVWRNRTDGSTAIWVMDGT